MERVRGGTFRRARVPFVVVLLLRRDLQHERIAMAAAGGQVHQLTASRGERELASKLRERHEFRGRVRGGFVVEATHCFAVFAEDVAERVAWRREAAIVLRDRLEAGGLRTFEQ